LRTWRKASREAAVNGGIRTRTAVFAREGFGGHGRESNGEERGFRAPNRTRSVDKENQREVSDAKPLGSSVASGVRPFRMCRKL